MNDDSPAYDVSSSALKVHTNEEDRPREKALKHGFDHLTIPELMAILLGSGTRGENVVQLCDRIMRDHEKWKENVENIVGHTDTIIFAFGADIGSWTNYTADNEKYSGLPR